MACRLGVVVPAYKQELFKRFVLSWDWYSDLYDIKLYLVEDNPEKTIKVPKWIPHEHYCWKDIDKDLGQKSWIISRRSSAIRSYGYYKAWQDGCEYVLTLDDDCLPPEHHDSIEWLARMHLKALTTKRQYSSYFNVGKFLFPDERLWMRGSPIRYRRGRSAVVSIGAWDNNPDLDAWTQLERQSPQLSAAQKCANVPKYSGLTMCGMNVLFSRETVPLAYFMLQGERWGVDRVDDIWAGLFMKKVLDHFDKPMSINGYAYVRHERASNAFTSLKKEGLTLLETELLWDRLMSVNIKGETFSEAYLDLVRQCRPEWFGTEEYGKKLLEAMRVWTSLFT